MEEFILRIGANASALKSELGRTGAWAKAWATTLVEDLHSKIGRMFAAGFALDKAMEFGKRVFENVKERVLAINRAQGELPGVSTNFIQGVFNYMQRVGLSFEAISKPLLKFKQLIDAAKINPGGAEMRTLERYNIVSGEADLKTQKYTTSIAKLSEAYLKSGKNLKVLQELIGKESISPAMLALLELGPDKLKALGNTNVFTSLTPANLEFFKNNFQGATGIGQVINATAGNLIGLGARLSPIGIILRGVNAAIHASDSLKHPIDTLKQIFTGRQSEAEIAEEKVKQSIEQEEQRVGIQNKLLELKEKERQLTAQIADHGKVSLDQMASEAQRLGGLQMPRLYGMTPRMLTSFKIKALEARSNIAYEQGNDALSAQLMNQAQAMRAANPWLMDKDRDPMKHANTELTLIKNELVPVQKMAEMVTKDSITSAAASGKSAGIEG